MYNVMIVDDEPLILKGLRAILDWSGHGLGIAAQAASGEEALERFVGQAIDIVITDIRMPGMSGLQLIETIRSIDPNVKFIVLSGYDDFPYVKEGIKLGIENYLLKPIDVDELSATLKGAVTKLDKQRDRLDVSQRERPILLDNLLLRWVTRSIPDADFRQRCEVVGIALEHSSYTVAVCSVMPLEWNGEPVSERLRLEFAARARDIVQTVCAAQELVFLDLDGDLIIIVPGDAEQAGREDVHASLAAYIRHIREQLPVRSSLSIGPTAACYTDVHESYARAKELQSRRFVNTEQSVVDGEKSGGRHDVWGELNRLELAELVAKRDEAGLAAWIDGAFELLRCKPHVSSADVQNCALEMLVQIGRMSRHAELVDLFRDVTQQRTIEQIQRYVAQFAAAAFQAANAEERELSPLIDKVLQDIHRGFAGELSLKTLSQAHNVHPVYLGQLFKRELRVGFSEYVSGYRIDIAKDMLANTPLKANEIAAKVGYADPNYFYKQFAKFTGVSPSEYRALRGGRAD